MSDSARVALRLSLGIRFTLIRQRSPWVFRRLLDKDRTEQERATNALLEVILEELAAFHLTERTRSGEAPAQATDSDRLTP